MEKLADQWVDRDYPVLLEAVKRIDQGEEFVRCEDLADALGRSPEQVRVSLGALRRRGFVQTVGAEEMPDIVVAEVSGYAYCLTGLHPDGDDLADRLIQAVGQAAELAADPDEKSRLVRLKESLLSIGGQTVAGLLTAAATGQFPVGG